MSWERSTSKVKRAREFSEIEHAPPRPLISKEMTQPHEVEEPQADHAPEELVLAASREEQDAPTAVSSAGLEEVPPVPSEEWQHLPTVLNGNPDDAQEEGFLVPSEEEQHSPTLSVLPVPSEEGQHLPTVLNANPDDAQEEGFPVRAREEQHSPTVVSSVHSGDLPKDVFQAETSTDVPGASNRIHRASRFASSRMMTWRFIG